jgi:AraC family transcriptional regulator, regulatory protein of adaptative response / DNA-3-methyladenine glycosylase II
MLALEREHCYQAMIAHDPRFDGVFFVGVSTTQIYCRNVCTVRIPHRENCTFYASAAAAEQAGYRPCLRCRPELAPGQAPIDAIGRLAAAIATRIEAGTLGKHRLDTFALELGVSERHLRRVVQREFGVSPIALAQTQRLLMAKRLLTDTDLAITDIAYASGFSSLRRFNALFKQRYRLNPSQLRKTHLPMTAPDAFICEVAYRSPLDWNALMQFLSTRSILGVESISSDRYSRTVAMDQCQGWVTVTPSSHKNMLQVELSTSLVSVLLPILTRIKLLFDLAAEPQQIAAHLGSLASEHPGLRVPGAFDSFEVAVRVILGQQVSVKAATTLMGRFVNAFGESIATPDALLNRLTPTAEKIAAVAWEEIASLGIVATRARSIVAIAQAIANQTLTLHVGGDVERTIAQLKTIPGIGEWTAQYLAMRVLAYPDAFPHTDLVIRKVLGENNPKRILAIAQQWQPWRAYAAMHLWKSLDLKTRS